jgi:hypothetical protein
MLLHYETLRNCGKFAIEFDSVEGVGGNVTKKLLSTLLENTVRRATQYIDETGDNVFAYKEEQLHSVICPSIGEISRSYVVEYPLKRKPAGEAEYSGNVDYWISYKHWSFLMELKHAYCGFSRNRPKEKIVMRLSQAVQQLKNIRKEECRNVSEYDKGLIKIALEGITFYKGSEKKEILNDFKTEQIEISFKKLVELARLKNKMNMCSLWLLNKRLVKPVEYSDRYEIYPAVAFLGKVFSG